MEGRPAAGSRVHDACAEVEQCAARCDIAAADAVVQEGVSVAVGQVEFCAGADEETRHFHVAEGDGCVEWAGGFVGEDHGAAVAAVGAASVVVCAFWVGAVAAALE
jgi:hypothetical protein